MLGAREFDSVDLDQGNAWGGCARGPPGRSGPDPVPGTPGLAARVPIIASTIATRYFAWRPVLPWLRG